MRCDHDIGSDAWTTRGEFLTMLGNRETVHVSD